jgi:hypothetical protein
MPRLEPQDVPKVRRCSICGAELILGGDTCWLCRSKNQTSDATINSPRSKSELSTDPASTSSRFSLASLLLFVTQICVLIGVATLWRGLAILLGIILLVVWSIIAIRARPNGTPVASTSTRVSAGAVVFVLLSAIVVIGAIAFVSLFAAIAKACVAWPVR